MNDTAEVQRERGIVTKVRKIVKMGNSYYIALPQEFVKKHGLRAKDELAVVSDNIIKVIPMTEIL